MRDSMLLLARRLNAAVAAYDKAGGPKSEFGRNLREAAVQFIAAADVELRPYHEGERPPYAGRTVFDP